MAVVDVVHHTVATNAEAPDGLIFMRKSTELQTEQEIVVPAAWCKSSRTVSAHTWPVVTVVISQADMKTPNQSPKLSPR